MKLLFVLAVALFIAGGSLTSCKRYPVDPPDTTHKCDTCCDTCHTDTTKVPCDTCNIDKDSAAHAFIWTEYNIPSETNLTGVWVFGPNDIMICANSLYHFDGKNFTVIDENITRHPNVSLNGALSGNNIFAFSNTDFWLVDGIANYSTDAHHLDDMRPAGNLHACWGTSSSDMFFVGDAGVIYHYDGTKFEEMSSGTTKDLRSIWGISHNDVWAGGHSDQTGQSVLVHYNGSSWEEIDVTGFPLNIYPGAKGHSLEHVWCIDSSGHKIVVASGSLVWRKTDNGFWRSDTAIIPNRVSDGGFIGLFGTQGNNINDFMTVGGWGWVGHWNGKTWKRYDELFNYGNSNYVTNAFSFRGNTACVVGFKNGQSWMAVGRRK